MSPQLSCLACSWRYALVHACTYRHAARVSCWITQPACHPSHSPCICKHPTGSKGPRRAHPAQDQKAQRPKEPKAIKHIAREATEEDALLLDVHEASCRRMRTMPDVSYQCPFSFCQHTRGAKGVLSTEQAHFRETSLTKKSPE